MNIKNRRLVDAVVKAWINKGSVPNFHMEMQRKLIEEWPTLANALIALSKARFEQGPPHLIEEGSILGRQELKGEFIEGGD